MPYLNSNHPTAPKQIAADLRGMRVLELRAEGLSYRKIAARLTAEGDSCDPGGAFHALKRALDKLNQEMKERTKDVRDLELERLDRMLAGVWPQAEAGDVKAIDAAIKLMDRRARYLGLDKPGEWPAGRDGEPEPPAVNVGLLSDSELEELGKLVRKVHNGE